MGWHKTGREVLGGSLAHQLDKLAIDVLLPRAQLLERGRDLRLNPAEGSPNQTTTLGSRGKVL